MDTEISVVPVLATINENIQTSMLKSMIPDSEWFNSDQTKFEDQWREI